MFAKFLRVGPLFVIESMLTLIGAFVYVVQDHTFWTQSLLEISLSLFLIQMIVSHHIVLTSKKHRTDYLLKMAASPNIKLYSTMVWNQVNLVSIMGIFLYMFVQDSIVLYQNGVDASKCSFLLFPLVLECLIELEVTKSIDVNYLWVLFVFFTLFNTILLAWVQLRMLKFNRKLIKDRKCLKKQYLQLMWIQGGADNIQSLITQDEDDEGEISRNAKEFTEATSCPICLVQLKKQQGKVRSLLCGHSFHEECLLEWLKQRPQCPYRCSFDSVCPRPNNLQQENPSV